MPPRQLQFSPVERGLTAAVELLELVGLDKKGELYRQRLYVSTCTLLSLRSPPHHTRPYTALPPVLIAADVAELKNYLLC